MKKEKYAGIVIFKKENKREYLLIKNKNGEYVLCRGQIGNEDEKTTAISSLSKNTRLAATLINGFRCVVKYKTKKDTIKKTVFYLGRAKIPDFSFVSDNYIFLPYNKALKKLTHKSDKEVLSAAEKFLCAR